MVATDADRPGVTAAASDGRVELLELRDATNDDRAAFDAEVNDDRHQGRFAHVVAVEQTMPADPRTRLLVHLVRVWLTARRSYQPINFIELLDSDVDVYA